LYFFSRRSVTIPPLVPSRFVPALFESLYHRRSTLGQPSVLQTHPEGRFKAFIAGAVSLSSFLGNLSSPKRGHRCCELPHPFFDCGRPFLLQPNLRTSLVRSLHCFFVVTFLFSPTIVAALVILERALWTLLRFIYCPNEDCSSLLFFRPLDEVVFFCPVVSDMDLPFPASWPPSHFLVRSFNCGGSHFLFFPYTGQWRPVMLYLFTTNQLPCCDSFFYKHFWDLASPPHPRHFLLGF